VRILSRYFVARYIGLFAVILVSGTLAVATVEAMLGFEDRGDPGQLLGWMLVRIPSYYLRDLAPISAFFAAFFTIGLAVRWLEWTAVQAAGIPPWRIALPLLGAALVLSGGTFALRESLVPRLLERHEAARQPSDEDLIFRAGSFWYQKGHSLYSIGSADRAAGTLRDVEVFVRTPRGRLDASYRAHLARVRPDGSWLLENAIVRRFSPDDPGRPTEVHEQPELVLTLTDDSALLLERTDAAALPLAQLIEYVAAHRHDDHPGSRAAIRRLDMLAHQRMSEPWLVALFSLLALPVALRVRPGGSLAPAGVAAMGVLGAFFLARNLGHGLAVREILPHAATIWLVPALFAAAAALALWPGAALRPR